MDWIDQYADVDSALHRWEPRHKLVGLMSLIFAFSFVQDLRLLPAMLAVTFILYLVSKLPLSYLLTRLRAPGFFLLLVAVWLPFVSGSTILLRIGPIALRQEGWRELLLLVAKFISILTTGTLLFGTASFLSMIKATRALGLPPILADMTLLSYRYLHEIGGDLKTMVTAMGMRGFRRRRLNGRTLGVLASLVGSILVRSYEQSERVYKAMVLRGYGRSSRSRGEFQSCPRDTAALGGVLLTAIGFVVGEVILRKLGG